MTELKVSDELAAAAIDALPDRPLGRRQFPLPKLADPAAPLLVVEDLKTHFSLESGTVRAVDGVSFTLQHGEALGIAGESGCGKTTTALSLVRLLPANATIVEGSIKLMGIDLVPKTDRQLRRFRCRAASRANEKGPAIRPGPRPQEAGYVYCLLPGGRLAGRLLLRGLLLRSLLLGRLLLGCHGRPHSSKICSDQVPETERFRPARKGIVDSHKIPCQEEFTLWITFSVPTSSMESTSRAHASITQREVIALHATRATQIIQRE